MHVGWVLSACSPDFTFAELEKTHKVNSRPHGNQKLTAATDTGSVLLLSLYPTACQPLS